jgi:hypothetical protein
MKRLFYIILFFIHSDCFGQDSAKINNSQIFIDSLKENTTLKIACYASSCFHHEKYTILIWKNKDNYFSKLTSEKTSRSNKGVFVKKYNRLNFRQIDSVRKFEKDLTIYPTEDTDGQKYSQYTLSINKRKKKSLMECKEMIG